MCLVAYGGTDLLSKSQNSQAYSSELQPAQLFNSQRKYEHSCNTNDYNEMLCQSSWQHALNVIIY